MSLDRTLDILQLQRDPTYPPTSGGEIRAWKTAHKLAEFGSVHVAYPYDSDDPVPDTVDRIRLRNPFLQHKLPKIYLWHVALFLESDNLLERVQTSITASEVRSSGVDFDVVFCEFPQVLRAGARIATEQDAKLVVNKHNAMYELFEQQLRAIPAPDGVKRRATENLRSLEQAGIARADAAVFQSSDDVERFDIPEGTLTAVIPNGCEFTDIEAGGDPDAVRDTLGRGRDDPLCVFVGAYDYEPNRLAAELILETVAPSLPEVDFLLVGRDPPSVDRDNVHTPGFVDDYPGVLAAADVALCPLTKGSGTKLKMMDYLAAGLPIVTTTVGTQGIDIADGETALVRDTPDGIVEGIEEVLSSPELRARLSSAAKELGRQFSWESRLRGYDRLMDELFA